MASEPETRDAARAWNVGALAVASIGLAALIGFVFLVILDVLLRWLFTAPIDGVAEISKLLAAVVIASFFPLSLAERQHIAIDLLGRAFPPGLRRFIEAFADIVTLAVVAGIAWRLILYTDETAHSGETTWILGWPVTPWWIAVSALVVFCVPVQALVVWRSLKTRSAGSR